MGLRFVKKTANFDDPGRYHFYFCDRQGTPGTILSFLPWGKVERGYAGSGMITEIGFSVPSLKSMGAVVTEKIYDNMGHTIIQDEIDHANTLIFNS